MGLGLGLNLGAHTGRSFGESYLLEDFPNAALAFSLRLVNPDYEGDCLRIMRGTDNATQDIGFVSGVVDVASMIAFCNVTDGNGYIQYWRDQSGNGRDVDRLSPGVMPQIISGGAVILENGKPAIRFVESNQDQLLSTYRLQFNASTVGVINMTTGFGTQFAWGQFNNNGQNNYYGYGMGSGDEYCPAVGDDVINVNNSGVAGDQQVIAGLVTRNLNEFDSFINETQYDDGVAVTAYEWDDALLAPDSSKFTIGAIGTDTGATNFRMNGTVQEVVAWESDQASNMASIQSAINSYYGVY